MSAAPSSRSGCGPEKEALLAERGLDDAQVHRFCEGRVLQLRVLEVALRLVPDGPSVEEGSALEARWRGGGTPQRRRRGR